MHEITELQSKGQMLAFTFADYPYFTWNMFVLSAMRKRIMLPYIYHYFYLSNKGENWTYFHTSKQICSYMFVNKSNFLHLLGLLNSFSLTWESWTNWRVPSKTSELVVNGTFVLSTLGFGTWTPGRESISSNLCKTFLISVHPS